MKLPHFLLLPLLLLLLTACEEDDAIYSPKPRGYCRINFPEKAYKPFDTTCPYQFQIPVYAKAVKPLHSENCFYNIEFPQFKATVHLSYLPVKNDLSKHIENSHYFANKHQIKATGLEETVILRDSAKVYGLLFDIAGNTASSLQFYLTDSSKHFLRGSLYFNSIPNIDSCKIVVDFIRKDVLHLINTAAWKKEN